MTPNPCITCGACCAAFRVSFYWAEVPPDSPAAHLTQALTPVLSCMAGTDQAQPRCVAIDGEIGAHTACTIYQHRPSPCREVMPGDDKCQRARERHHLPPL